MANKPTKTQQSIQINDQIYQTSDSIRITGIDYRDYDLNLGESTLLMQMWEQLLGVDLAVFGSDWPKIVKEVLVVDQDKLNAQRVLYGPQKTD